MARRKGPLFVSPLRRVRDGRVWSHFFSCLQDGVRLPLAYTTSYDAKQARKALVDGGALAVPTQKLFDAICDVATKP